MKLYDVSYNLKTQNILTEGWSTLTENQRTYLSTAERELWPLMEQLTKAFEAELTPVQIQSIFKGAEDHAMASGGHKSILGKAGQVAKLPLDLMKKLEAKISELGRMAQNTGPVKNMDAKFEELKKKIGASDGKIVQGIKFVSDWAKANPGKATLAVAILTAAAAFSGIGGGAAVGFLLRGTKDLLQGEKLSTAVGRAVKTAAYGAMAGWLFNQIGDWFTGIRADMVPYKETGITELKIVVPRYEWSGTNIMGLPANGYIEANATMYVPDNIGTAWIGGGDTMMDWFKEQIALAEAGDLKAFHQVQEYVGRYTKEMAAEYAEFGTEVAKDLAIKNDAGVKALTTMTDTISALAQGSVTAGAGGQPGIKPEDTKAKGKSGEDFDKGGTPPTGESINYETYLHQRLDELVPPKPNGATAPAPAPTGPAPTGGGTPAPAPAPTFGQRVKSGLSKVGGAIGRGAKELGNKVTLNKLTTAWKRLGSPTDTGSIVNILSDIGLNNQEITAIGANTKIDLAPGAGTAKKPQAPAPGTAKKPQAPAPGTAGGDDTAQTDASPLNNLAKQIKSSGQSDLIKMALQLSAAGVTKQQLMTADIHNEAELKEGLKDWAKNLAMAGIIVGSLAGVGSINDALNNSVPAIKAMNNALEMAQDAGNDELVKTIEKDIRDAKLRLDIGKDLNQVKYLQDKYSKFMPTEGLAYESKLAVMLNQRLK